MVVWLVCGIGLSANAKALPELNNVEFSAAITRIETKTKRDANN